MTAEYDEELSLDVLEGVYGGAGETICAYCKLCGHLMKWLRNERIGGGNTGIYICKNPNCPEEDNEKNNGQVIFR